MTFSLRRKRRTTLPPVRRTATAATISLALLLGAAAMAPAQQVQQVVWRQIADPTPPPIPPAADFPPPAPGGAPVAGAREVREHRSKPRCKAVTALRHNAHCATRRATQIFDIRFRAHDGDFHAVKCLRKRYRVVKKTTVQLADRFERKTLSQPSLHRAQSGSFGHDDERAVHWCHQKVPSPRARFESPCCAAFQADRGATAFRWRK